MDRHQLANLLRIQEASRHDRLVIFVGAGVSKNSGVPLWSELINVLKSELPSPLNSETDDLKIAQLYKDARGHKEYMDKVREVLKCDEVTPNALHKSILALNPCNIITTNYDDLLEQEINNEFKQYDIIRQDKDLPRMMYPNTLIKMHGDYITDNIVLTEEDYYNYSRNFPLIRSYVMSLFASKLVLFVGFSFSDLNLKRILNDVKGILSNNMQRAYILTCDLPNHTLESYYEKKGINLIYMNDSDLSKICDSEGNLDDHLGKIGHKTNSLLYAIKNGHNTGDKDLVTTLYERIISYNDQIRVFDNGLKTIFPKHSYDDWYFHSDGLQIHSTYFKNLAENLKSKSDIRFFFSQRSCIDIFQLRKIAYNNSLYTIDDIRILNGEDEERLERVYGTKSIILYHDFDFLNLTKVLRTLSNRERRGNIDDMEYPYVLYLLGHYYEAFLIYKNIQEEAWDKHKYILYFMCLYNMWAIRNAVNYQLSYRKDIDKDSLLKDVRSLQLDNVLEKIPIDEDLKKMLQNVVSYRMIGDGVVKTEGLRDDIYDQRRMTENGGWSLNGNILSLIGNYLRVTKFCHQNFMICNNSNYYHSLCRNTVLGILNSFATPPAQGAFSEGTRIDEIDSQMLKIMIFEVSTKELDSFVRRYDIPSFRLHDSAIAYLNIGLHNLLEEGEEIFFNQEKIGDCLGNLFYIISKSNLESINVADLIGCFIKYWAKADFQASLLGVLASDSFHFENASLLNGLLTKLIYHSHYSAYTGHCVAKIVKLMEVQGELYKDLRWTILEENKAMDFIYSLYTIIPENQKEKFRNLCYSTIKTGIHYVHFVVQTHIVPNDMDRFISFISGKIDYQISYLLKKALEDDKLSPLHPKITELVKDVESFKFYMYPFNYQEYENVRIDWILEYTDDDMRINLFKIAPYKALLKEFIKTGHISKSYKDFLLKYL